MFEVDGETLNVEIDMSLEEVLELREFLLPRLEYIEAVGVRGVDQAQLATSALLQLLVSLKRSNPDLDITLLEGDSTQLGDLGILYWNWGVSDE